MVRGVHISNRLIPRALGGEAGDAGVRGPLRHERTLVSPAETTAERATRAAAEEQHCGELLRTPRVNRAGWV